MFEARAALSPDRLDIEFLSLSFVRVLDRSPSHSILGQVMEDLKTGPKLFGSVAGALAPKDNFRHFASQLLGASCKHFKSLLGRLKASWGVK